MTTPDPLAAGQALRDAQAVEYGAWVATEQIYVGGALAYNVGDAVPTSNVKAYGYDKLNVAVKSTSKAAAAATAQAASGPTVQGA